MNGAPPYWYELTAGAAVVLIVACLFLIAVCMTLMVLLLQVRKSISLLTERVQTIANRVDSVAKQVEQVTTEVGSRASGIVRTVDDIAGTAFSVVERFAPLVLGLAVVFKLGSMFKKSRQ